MAYKTDISVGAPPLLWSNVQQAFDEINQNFLELAIALGDQLDLAPLQFTNLETSITPTNSNEFSLGSASKTWKSLYVAEWFNIPGNQLNGVWLGDAQIRGTGTTIDLPANSTVNGQLIINPSNTSFKTISVPSADNIVADSFTDTLTIVPNNGIIITTNAGTDTLTITNDGVRTIQGSTYIGVSAPKGDNVTLTNLGVTNLQAGAGISLNNTIGTVEITNSGIRGITSGGGGITVFIDPSTRIASIGNATPTTRSFATIKVTGQTDLEADSATDVLRVEGGYGINVSTSENIVPGLTEEQLTISFDNRVDIVGSVFADNSSILVDSVSGIIYGDVRATTLRTAEARISLGDGAGSATSGTAIAIGSSAGSANQSATGLGIGFRAAQTDQGTSGIAIGTDAGRTSQGNIAVAIGTDAGETSQGTSSVAIGDAAGRTSQGNNAVSIGSQAGMTSQGSIAVAIGQNAGEISQGSSGVAIGYYAGKDSQDTGAVAIGYVAAQVTQGTAGVAVGWGAGQTNQGDYAIAIGYRAGFVNQHASSIVLNGSGALLNTTGTGFYVNPIRSNSTGRPLIYDTATSELSYSSVLEFVGSRISTTDSSGITVDVTTTFNTQVNIEGTLTVNDGITGYISLNELKSVVAASTDFGDFQLRIAALV